MTVAIVTNGIGFGYLGKDLCDEMRARWKVERLKDARQCRELPRLISGVCSLNTQYESVKVRRP